MPDTDNETTNYGRMGVAMCHALAQAGGLTFQCTQGEAQKPLQAFISSLRIAGYEVTLSPVETVNSVAAVPFHHEYEVGSRTMREVFEHAGMHDMSDTQEVLDAVEEALARAEIVRNEEMGKITSSPELLAWAFNFPASAIREFAQTGQDLKGAYHRDQSRAIESERKEGDDYIDVLRFVRAMFRQDDLGNARLTKLIASRIRDKVDPNRFNGTVRLYHTDGSLQDFHSPVDSKDLLTALRRPGGRNRASN